MKYEDFNFFKKIITLQKKINLFKNVNKSYALNFWPMGKVNFSPRRCAGRYLGPASLCPPAA